jgi:hypothetical protein
MEACIEADRQIRHTNLIPQPHYLSEKIVRLITALACRMRLDRNVAASDTSTELKSA